MRTPFFKKEKGGFLIKLHKALYPASAIEVLKEQGVAVGSGGIYWSLKFEGFDEVQALEALDQLLSLSKGHRLS